MNVAEYLATRFSVTAYDKGRVVIHEADRPDLAKMFADLGYKVGAEIGTASGDFAELLCKTNPDLELYCIDPYVRYREYHDMKAVDLADEYDKARVRLAHTKTKFMPVYSLDAAREFEDNSLDFVYIDANHSLPWVMDDICAWYAKVRPGGVVSGHDYHEMNNRVHVKYAVDAFTQAYNIMPWFVLGDRYHSWLFEKR